MDWTRNESCYFNLLSRKERMRSTEDLNYAPLCKKIRRILKVMVLESWTSEIHLNGYSHEVTERQREQRCLPRVCISNGDKCCSFFGNQCT